MSPRGYLYLLLSRARLITPRRLLLLLFGVILISTLSLITLSTKALSEPLHSLNNIKAALPESISQLKVPDVRVPNIISGPAVHFPLPPAANGTESSDKSWFGTLKWLVTPFSSSISGAHGIALPPVEERCTLYTYNKKSADKDQAELEDRLLITWRRAWWAYGFNPIILGPAEAKAHELYKETIVEGMNSDLKWEMERILAWGHVKAGAGGKGILMDYRIFPMAPRDDDVISTLRSCRFGALTGYRDLSTRLLTGDESSLNKLTHLFQTGRWKKDSKTLLGSLDAAETTPENTLKINSRPSSLADYADAKSIYSTLKPTDLPNLINSHLHLRLQSQFRDGVGILSPNPKDLNPLHVEARTLATRLAACPATPLPLSCPPNIPHCTPCTNSLPLSDPPTFLNGSNIFILGLVPHPYTTLSLTTLDINLATDTHSRLVAFIRRKSPRDVYTRAITEQLIKLGLGTKPRLVAMKEVIAARGGKRVVSMWGTDESGFVDSDWTLGFIPAAAKADEIQVQQTGKTRLIDAKAVLKNRKPKILAVVESWNLADTELWGFVRAWENRKAELRRSWSAEERRYSQGVGKDE